MPRNNQQANIIERLLEPCERPTYQPFGFLHVDEDVWKCPADPTQVAAALAAEFTAEQLAASGIVIVGDDGSANLAAGLAAGELLIVLRDVRSGEAYDVLTREGTQVPGTLPVFEILRDRYTQQCQQQESLDQAPWKLIVAFDMEHAVLLRACGLPATLASGLEHLPLEGIDRFCETFGLDLAWSDRAAMRDELLKQGAASELHPDDPVRRVVLDAERDGGPTVPNTPPTEEILPRAGSLGENELQLAFLAWTPLELSSAMPCGLKVVVDYFHQLKQFMAVELFDLKLWMIEENTIERLRFIADRRSAAFFREAMLDAAFEINTCIEEFGKETPLALGPPADYASALACYHAANASEIGSRLLSTGSQKSAWNDVQKYLQEQVIQPLRQCALAGVDPVERTQLLAVAELSNTFHMTAVVIGERMSRRIAESGMEGVDELPAEQIKQLLAIADRLINLTKATQSCSPRRSTTIESRMFSPVDFPRLPRSG
jgi:hypothetical protein